MDRDEHSKHDSARNGDRRCVIFWTSIILAATLFPYIPVFPEYRSMFALNPIGNPGDFLANIFLFIPWGFFVAGMFAKGYFRRHRALIVLVLGLVLSGMVEFVQLGLPSRIPALADILANLWGTGVGVWLEASRGERLRSWFSSFGGRISRAMTIRVLVGLVVIHTVLVWGMFRYADYRSSFSNWDSSYPMNIGNERTGDRPWVGDLDGALLWESVLSGGEADPLWSLDSPAGPFDQRTEALMQSGKFTLSVVVQTGDTSQTGPGRIISLSVDPLHRNLTLGQEGPDLVFRLRTPFTGLNGSNPALIVPGVFSEVEKRHIVVTYDGAVLKVYPGSGAPPAQLNFRYAGVFTGMGFRFHAADQYGYRIVFWGMVGLPPGLLLLVLAFRVRTHRIRK